MNHLHRDIGFNYNIASVNPVVDAETWYVDADKSIAFIALRGANNTIINHGSDIEYEVVSGIGELKMRNEQGKISSCDISHGSRVVAPKGLLYQTSGNLMMLATSRPPYQHEAVEVVRHVTHQEAS